MTEKTEFIQTETGTSKVTLIEPVFDDGGFLENNLIILTKMTIDKILEYDNPMEIIGLYTFYYYTAKWQKTNSIYCTTGYAANGLKCSKDRIRKYKNILTDIGLVHDLKRTDDDGKITGHFIKLNYIIKNQTVKNHAQGFPEYGNNQRVENSDTNALSTNNLNALSTNNKKTLKKSVPKVPLKKYGERVKLKESDYNDLCTLHTKNTVDSKIIDMNDYLLTHGKTYKNYNAALRGWIKKDKDKQSTQKPINPVHEMPCLDDSDKKAGLRK